MSLCIERPLKVNLDLAKLRIGATFLKKLSEEINYKSSLRNAHGTGNSLLIVLILTAKIIFDSFHKLGLITQIRGSLNWTAKSRVFIFIAD